MRFENSLKQKSLKEKRKLLTVLLVVLDCLLWELFLVIYEVFVVTEADWVSA
jgi:hypothetical protein